MKKAKSSLLGHWKTSSDSSLPSQDSPSRQLNKYLSIINSPDFEYSSDSLKSIIERHDFAMLAPLFEFIFCTPSKSAPVETIFSHSGLITRPNS
jgi:hypothetical protein